MKNKAKNNLPNDVYAGMNPDADFIKNVQKLTIEELIELYAYAEAIVETVREPLLVLDKDLRVKSANKGFFETFRVVPKEIIGKLIFELGNGQWDIPLLKKLLLEVLPKNKKVEDFEVDHDFPEIGQKVMVLNARTIVLEQYRTNLILLAIEDITDKKLIEERTERFISIASHELRTPITSVMSFMQVLERKLKATTDSSTQKIITHMISQLNGLNKLIGDLFDTRKIKEGAITLNKKQAKIDSIVKAAIKNLKHAAPDHHIILQGSSTKKVTVDRDRISQVIINLLTNAIKYSPQGKKIQVNISQDSQKVTVSVQDFGIGIGAKDQKHLFEPYYTSEKKLTNKGMGLGLYVSKEIVNLHGGEIWVESQLGKGTTFHISLPHSQ